MMLGTRKATFNIASNFSFAAMLFLCCDVGQTVKNQKQQVSLTVAIDVILMNIAFIYFKIYKAIQFAVWLWAMYQQ